MAVAYMMFIKELRRIDGGFQKVAHPTPPFNLIIISFIIFVILEIFANILQMIKVTKK